ncbi:flagellar basal body-associated FliL family protein [Pseudaminobacter salicylatoxidans]|uniref:flagellar basal body-associated FliL family protein n=1 Tax=Pseudaminobacter salicylatoxidans TaxID=93369 RepID=UPI0002D5497A|nr:flagellar basal body-associated FliL family protein [Pseudaminobacter salicylatoxidans]
MSIVEQTTSEAKGPSLIVQSAVLLAMTAAAIGLGWAAGQYLYRNDAARIDASVEATAEAENEAHEPGARGIEITLAPITTNLAVPGTTWVRMEASIILDEPAAPSLADDIHQDFVAYLRTLRVYQVEGATGFRNLKADLEERAKIRSGGLVRQVLIQTLLFE